MAKRKSSVPASRRNGAAPSIDTTSLDQKYEPRFPIDDRQIGEDERARIHAIQFAQEVDGTNGPDLSALSHEEIQDLVRRKALIVMAKEYRLELVRWLTQLAAYPQILSVVGSRVSKDPIRHPASRYPRIRMTLDAIASAQSKELASVHSRISDEQSGLNEKQRSAMRDEGKDPNDLNHVATWIKEHRQLTHTPEQTAKSKTARKQATRVVEARRRLTASRPFWMAYHVLLQVRLSGHRRGARSRAVGKVSEVWQVGVQTVWDALSDHECRAEPNLNMDIEIGLETGCNLRSVLLGLERQVIAKAVERKVRD